MSKHDGTWDESRSGPRTEKNLLSFPDDGRLYLATQNVLDWNPCGAHDAKRMVLPSIYGEALFRKAPVAEPSVLKLIKVITRCLGMDEYMGPGIDLLLDEGLTTAVDDEGNEVEVIFEHIDDLYEKADKLVIELKDDARLTVTADSFDWLEGFTDSAANAAIKWFADYSLEDATKTSKNLEAYIYLALVLGPHATERVRIDPTSTCFAMIGAGDGRNWCPSARAMTRSSRQ